MAARDRSARPARGKGGDKGRSGDDQRPVDPAGATAAPATRLVSDRRPWSSPMLPATAVAGVAIAGTALLWRRRRA
jgi:hypothetical protein